jgi:hypothetical protein
MSGHYPISDEIRERLVYLPENLSMDLEGWY